jgi:glycosyltransferase involved in cell wall biosynthesis
MMTIFTATYNRGQYLKKIYNSLLSQVAYDFEWLIVDDGSTDQTKNIVDSFISESRISIRYYYQTNQGKHIAFNKGIDLAKGDFFICVDSDDNLTDKAISVINDSIAKLQPNNIGVVYPQSLNYENDKYKWSNIDKNEIDIIDLKEKYRIIESAILIRTKILKKYHFPEFKNDDGKKEKFCSEGLLFNKLISDGKFVVCNSVIYVSNYLDDGLTKSLFNKIWINNFYSTVEDFRLRYITARKFKLILRIKTRIKAVINLNALCIKKRKYIYKYTPSIFYSSILFLPSLLFKIYRYRYK